MQTRQAPGFIAVADIHGCPAQLEEILELGREFPEHQWVFLGDYIDRGPDSEAVIRRLSGLEAVFLVGNHEQMLLSRLTSARGASLRAGWARIAGLSEQSLQWLETALVDRHETDDYVFVHGGLDVTKPLDQQSNRDVVWTRYAGDYRAVTPKWVIHGHTAIAQPEIIGNRVNLNTDCSGGGPLTALVLPEFRYLQSSPSPSNRGGLHFSAQDYEDLVEEL